MPIDATFLLRFALYVDTMLLFGLPLFGLYALNGEERRSLSVLRRSAVAAIAAAGSVLSVLAMLCLIASMTGTSVSDLDPAVAKAVVMETPIGQAFQWRLVACLLALFISACPWRAAGHLLMLSGVAGGVALGSLAWTGHGAMDEGVVGWLHLGADILHLLAAGLWFGALVAFLSLLALDMRDAENRRVAVRALTGFGSVGLAVVIILTITGVINVWVLVIRAGGSLWPLDLYPGLLLVKVAVFAAMIALASANRFWLTPSLARTGARMIRRSLLAEAGFGLIILALVAQLGRLSPGG